MEPDHGGKEVSVFNMNINGARYNQHCAKQRTSSPKAQENLKSPPFLTRQSKVVCVCACVCVCERERERQRNLEEGRGGLITG